MVTSDNLPHGAQMKFAVLVLGTLLLAGGPAVAQNNAAGGSNQTTTTPVGTIEPSASDASRHRATIPSGTDRGNAEATAAAHRDLDQDDRSKRPSR